MAIEPDVAAFALGFATFLAVVGSALVAPPDPFVQLFVLAAFLAVLAPVVHRVLAADRVGRYDERSRLPFPYFVAVTVGSTLAAVAVPATGRYATLLEGGAFLAAAVAVSLVTVRLGREADGPAAGE